MRLLPDENLPKQLKIDFPNHDVFMVRNMGWNGIKNGELLSLMVAMVLIPCLHPTNAYNINKTSSNIRYGFCDECRHQSVC